jgi:hypothetical protein
VRGAPSPQGSRCCSQARSTLQNSRGTLRATVQDGGCLLGELFGHVNGVCDPLHPLAPGDNGPSGEDVTHRFVLAGSLRASM